MGLSHEDRREQANVFAEAMEIYEERSAARGQLWKEFDERDAAVHIRSKAARLYVAVENPDADGADAEALDSALDLINYAAFAVRHIRNRSLRPSVTENGVEVERTDATARPLSGAEDQPHG